MIVMSSNGASRSSQREPSDRHRYGTHSRPAFELARLRPDIAVRLAAGELDSAASNPAESMGRSEGLNPPPSDP